MSPRRPNGSRDWTKLNFWYRPTRHWLLSFDTETSLGRIWARNTCWRWNSSNILASKGYWVFTASLRHYWEGRLTLTYWHLNISLRSQVKVSEIWHCYTARLKATHTVTFWHLHTSHFTCKRCRVLTHSLTEGNFAFVLCVRRNLKKDPVSDDMSKYIIFN